MDQQAKASHYEIHIGGLLGERLLMAFPELDVRALGHVTVLVGDLPDQAALHGAHPDRVAWAGAARGSSQRLPAGRVS